jgi:hypothetical protein
METQAPHSYERLTKGGYPMHLLKSILIVIMICLVATIAPAAEKQLTIEWQQAEDDLPDLARWELFMSLDPDLPFDQWALQGPVPYDGNPASWYDATFTITVPDGAETATWFKMTAIDTGGLTSAPSELQEGAPTVIDFKPPAAVVDLAAVYDNQPKTVTLTWSTDPDDTDIATQEVFKATAAGGPYTSIGQGSSPFVYQLQPSDSGKWIYFVVVLTDNDGNFSPNSNEAAVKLSMGIPFGLKVTVLAQ